MENDMLGMDDQRTRGGRGQAGETGVNESAEVVGMDEVKISPSDQVPQSLNRAQRKSGRFPERDKCDPLTKPFCKGAASAQAAYRNIEALRIEVVADLNHNVLHPALMKAVNNLEKSDLLHFP
jgi:hypothetical protein